MLTTLRRMCEDWKGLRKDVEDVTGTCVICSRVKTPLKTNNVQNAVMGMPTTKMSDIAMDFMELPLQTGSDGLDYDKALLVVDRGTRYVEGIPCLKTDDSSTTWRRFEEKFVLRYGPPLTILTDRDPLFLGKNFVTQAKATGIKMVRTCARTPQTDGLSERMVQSVKKQLLLLREESPGSTWVDLLPSALFCINTSMHSVMKDIPFRLLHGYVPDALPSGLFPVRRGPDMDEEEMEAALSAARGRVEMTQIRVLEGGRQSDRFKVGDWVQVASGKKAGSRKWRPRWVGPFQVREANGHGAVLVEYEPGKTKWFSARWLSRYVGSEEDLVALEPNYDTDGAWVRGWMAEERTRNCGGRRGSRSRR